MTPEEIGAFYNGARVSIENNPRLREPQQQGHAAAVAHFAADGGPAIEQIPVGCGKTGLITLLPFGCAKGRVLVIAPNLTIRDQLVSAFDGASSECFYRKSRALTDLSKGPWVAALDADANLGDLKDAHVAVTNIQQLAAGGGRWLAHLPADFFDLIVVDEGHHNAATSWQDVFKRFPAARVLSLTATPFRADDQPIEGEVIYKYPIAEAMRRGYIKHIQASNVAPRELVFSYRGDEQLHTLEEVLRLKDKDWFSRGVALAEACNVSIVDASIEWLKHLREGGTHHQIVAAACSVDHARAIRRLYEERGLHAHEIHSKMRETQKARVLRDLADGVLDAIVQVQMLGEGFDHPPLSTAAIFRPYRSLSPYIQFVGRAMRVNRETSPGHPDNRGIVVSHVGLNLDRHWEDFKQVDVGDQQMIQDWLHSGPKPPPKTRDGDGREPLLPDMIVKHELTLDRFLGDQFLEITDDVLPERVLAALRAQGIDPGAAGLSEEILRALVASKVPQEPTKPVAQPVRPQARRQSKRARLNEQARVLAVRVCQEVGLSPGGKRLAVAAGVRANSDLQAVIQFVHTAVNEHLGISSRSRRDLTLVEIEKALGALEAIGDLVRDDIKERLA